MTHDIQTINEDDAFHLIVQALRESWKTEYSNYGYDLYLPNVVRYYLTKLCGQQQDPAGGPKEQQVSPAFLSAAWELARRGIIRPGVKAFRQQSTDDGSAGLGFSITPSGRKWLKEAGQYEFVPIEPGRFSRQLESFAARFNTGFQERSQEAIRCYGANAYLACCAMCGAAAESVLLAVAIEKDGDASKVEKMYLANGGRGRVEKLILGQQKTAIQDEFRGYLSLLKYWRDSASHGHRTGVGDNEAYTALAVLLRFAHFVDDRWDDLTH